jgi:hypothetical protein
MLRKVLFCLALGLANGASAQQGDSVRLLFSRAHLGNWYLRVRLADSTVLGRVPAVRADEARLGLRTVRFEEVTGIERRLRIGSGAKQAGIATGLLLGGFGAALYSGFCEGDCSGSGLLAITGAGFGMGFALGGFVGGVFAPGRLEWRPLYPPSAVVAYAASRRDTIVAWSPRVTTLYIAGSFAAGDVPPLIPYLYGLQIASQRKSVEVTFLDVFATWDGPAQGLDAVVGANFNISDTNYLGFATGVADLFHDYRTIAVARLGVHNVLKPGIRLELRGITTLRDPVVAGYVVFGYDIRRLVP